MVMCLKKIFDFLLSKDMAVAVVSGVVATALWTGLTKSYTSFENWVFSKPLPYTCISDKEPGIFMKEYAWVITVPLSNREVSSLMIINNEDFVILKDSLSHSQGELRYKIGEDQGGLYKGKFLELDTDEKNKNLTLNFKTRSSNKLKDDSCENFQILLNS